MNLNVNFIAIALVATSALLSPTTGHATIRSQKGQSPDFDFSFHCADLKQSLSIASTFTLNPDDTFPALRAARLGERFPRRHRLRPRAPSLYQDYIKLSFFFEKGAAAFTLQMNISTSPHFDYFDGEAVPNEYLNPKLRTAFDFLDEPSAERTQIGDPQACLPKPNVKTKNKELRQPTGYLK